LIAKLQNALLGKPGRFRPGPSWTAAGSASATPLLPVRTVVAIPKTLDRSKTLSPLRSASAVHDAWFPSPLIFHFCQPTGWALLLNYFSIPDILAVS
jgi:hypothetical protein